MKVIETDIGDVILKMMSLRDLDNALREKAKLIKAGYSEEVAETVANVMHGVAEAPFDLTVDGVLDLPMHTSIKIVEGIGEVNDPLGDRNQPASDTAD